MNQQQFFKDLKDKVEEGSRVTVEIVGGVSKVLYKEKGKYYLDIGEKKNSVSRKRSRTEIHNMVARLLDEQRTQGKE